MAEVVYLAPSGSTANGNYGGSALHNGAWEAFALQFVVEAAGGSPTVTYQFQGSLDGVNWYPIGYVTDASDTISTASRVRTSVGTDVCFISNPVARRYTFIRCVVSGINNVTFRAEAWRVD
ncbi:MAG TPA: hypothetical protein VHL57_12010 [Flavobacteriales bacterium]|jgi:hypothetical protein|nr:hypothetical protein [Flavobacteriales bacterium]